MAHSYDDINSNEFTQKDLMQFLLHSTQHMVTREELQTVKQEIKEELGRLREEMKAGDEKLSQQIGTLREEMKAGDEKLSQQVGTLREEMKAGDEKLLREMKAGDEAIREEIKAVAGKLDRLQWFLLAAVIALLLKELAL